MPLFNDVHLQNKSYMNTNLINLQESMLTNYLHLISVNNLEINICEQDFEKCLSLEVF